MLHWYIDPTLQVNEMYKQLRAQRSVSESGAEISELRRLKPILLADFVARVPWFPSFLVGQTATLGKHRSDADYQQRSLIPIAFDLLTYMDIQCPDSYLP